MPKAESKLSAIQRTSPSGRNVDDVRRMNDDEFEDFVLETWEMKIPDGLNTSNGFQYFSYAVGNKEKPRVVSQEEFDRLSQNAPVMYRTVNDTSGITSKEIIEDFLHGGETYVGNGVYGQGLYFSTSLKGSQDYGWTGHSHTIATVLNKKARVVEFEDIYREWLDHNRNRKRSGKTGNSDLSSYAMRKGYNVIRKAGGNGDYFGEDYYDILDRSVLSTTGKYKKY